MTYPEDNAKPKARGRLLAEFLSGCWRTVPAPLDLSASELALLNPLLQGSGASGLGWWRLRDSPFVHSETAMELKQAYRRQALDAARRELDIQQVFSLLRNEGIEPLLVKGWAVARLYPSKGLRPIGGDMDLIIQPKHLASMKTFLQQPDNRKYCLDLTHEEIFDWSEADFEDAFIHAQSVRLGETEVRVMGWEDHLRYLCQHLLRHGVWRPLWLCDVAVMLENRPSPIDWQRCLGKNRHIADWVLGVMRLAYELLGADVSDSPAENQKLPHWFLSTVLTHWCQPTTAEHRPPELIAVTLRHPRRLPQALRARWPDAISASFRMRAPFNEWPRLPFQLANYAQTFARFFGREVASLSAKTPGD
ncbi:MAG: nucleotidyltransferase family protein [Acidobacteriota bacterium]